MRHRVNNGNVRSQNSIDRMIADLSDRDIVDFWADKDVSIFDCGMINLLRINGNFKRNHGATVNIYGTSSVSIIDCCKIFTYDHSVSSIHRTLMDDRMSIWRHMFVKCKDKSTVMVDCVAFIDLMDSSTAVLTHDCKCTARDDSTVFSFYYGTGSKYSPRIQSIDHSRVFAYGTSEVQAYGDSVVYAHDRAKVYLHDRATVIKTGRNVYVCKEEDYIES